MGFIEDVAKCAEKIRKNAEQVNGEEATKHALILPFIHTLGYDIWNPKELIPEYVADFAIKVKPLKKVDYAIAINEPIVMLVEAKARDQKAEAHDGQLAYYFNGLSSAKVAIVTNGVVYRFFTDLQAPNKMDTEPFFSFNILQYEPKDLDNLKLFHRDDFDATAIGKQAEEMVYVQGMTDLLGNLLRTPSKEFMKFLLKEISNLSPNYAIIGQINDNKIAKFEPIIKKSIQNSLVDLMTRSINQEMAQLGETTVITSQPSVTQEIPNDDEAVESDKIIPTPDERDAIEKIQTLIAKSSEHKGDIDYKKVTAYTGVYISRPSRWFLRLYLLSKRKSIVTRLSIDEVMSLIPGFEVEEISTALGEAKSRIFISSVSELDNIESLIHKCYETEAIKHIKH